MLQINTIDVKYLNVVMFGCAYDVGWSFCLIMGGEGIEVYSICVLVVFFILIAVMEAGVL